MPQLNFALYCLESDLGVSSHCAHFCVVGSQPQAKERTSGERKRLPYHFATSPWPSHGSRNGSTFDA